MEEIKKALLKKALGFSCDEVVEEYSLDENGNSVLNKRKVTKKYNPPDISAMKMLIEKENFSDESLSHMTLAELKKEKKRLLKQLKEEEERES